MLKNKTAVIIPAYNEEKNIRKLIEELFKKGFKRNEIIIIDDGSQDKTADEAKGKGVYVIRNKKNMGKGYAQKLGFLFARKKGFKYVITMDADGQHSVDDIDKFLKNKKYDMVIGRRRISKKIMPLDRVISNTLTSLVVSILSSKRIKDSQCGYRLLNLSKILKIPITSKKYEAESELLIKACRAGLSIKEVPIVTVYDRGKSHIHRFKDTLRFLILSVKLILYA